jgi:hypothetical protein
MRTFHLPVLSTCMVCASAFLSGCGSVPQDGVGDTGAARQHAASSQRLTVTDAAGTVVVQKVEFRTGASSATVERLAKGAGCYGRQGAGLVTEKGPVEVYRMQCDNGSVFVARCELRQCRPMR